MIPESSSQIFQKECSAKTNQTFWEHSSSVSFRSRRCRAPILDVTIEDPFLFSSMNSIISAQKVSHRFYPRRVNTGSTSHLRISFCRRSQRRLKMQFSETSETFSHFSSEVLTQSALPKK